MNRSSDINTLSTIGRRRYVSISGLAGVLEDIRDHGMPSCISRSSIKRARDIEFAKNSVGPYGEALKEFASGDGENGDPKKFWYLDPLACLYYFTSNCSKLALFLKERLREHPSNIAQPWNLIVYADEIVSDNPLKHLQHRKTQALYYSFLELGPALSSEWFWFTLTATRSEDVACFGQFCRDLFLNFNGFELQGFQCGDIVIWAKLSAMIADEAALKATLDVKGASGSLPCFKCRNVISKHMHQKVGDTAGLVSISCTDKSKLELHTCESMVANAEHLRSQKGMLSKRKFQELEKSLGLTFSPEGVLLCPQLTRTLDTATSVFYDWVHVYLVHGVYNQEVGQILQLLKAKMRITHKDIHAFFSEFSWPNSLSQTGKSVFQKRSAEGNTIVALQCSASEGLGSYALLKEFLCLRVFDEAPPDVQGACVCYYALCDVLDHLSITTRGCVEPAKLHSLIVKHLELHKQTFGDSHWVPKMHYPLHLADQMVKCGGFCVGCFTHERKHKELKRYIQPRSNTSGSFEKGILQDVAYLQLLSLQGDAPYPRGTCLLTPRAAPIKLAQLIRNHLGDPGVDVMSATQAKVSGAVTCHVNDVVFLDWEGSVVAGRILFLCSLTGTCMAGIVIFTKMPAYNMYHTKGSEWLVSLDAIIDTAVFKMDGDVAFVLQPRGVAVRAKPCT